MVPHPPAFPVLQADTATQTNTASKKDQCVLDDVDEITPVIYRSSAPTSNPPADLYAATFSENSPAVSSYAFLSGIPSQICYRTIPIWQKVKSIRP